MDINQQTTSSSSFSPADDQHQNPDGSVDQSAANEVSSFNHLQIKANSDSNSNSQQLMPESPETDVEDQQDDDDEDDDGDFTFVCVGNNDSPTTEILDLGQIRTVFPLFDRSLLYGGDYDVGKLRLPADVPVDKVFLESQTSPSGYRVTAGTVRGLSDETDSCTTIFHISDRSLLSGGDYDAGKLRLPIDVPVDQIFIKSQPSPFEQGETNGTVTESGTPEINMKSNSTGFSKLWRIREEMNRSNSESRDAFVFLEATAKVAVAGGESTAKVNVAGPGGGNGKAVRKGLTTKKSTASAHEVYLKQKGGRSEDDRRRSYLPYRPGLMGFFTNVNGGLSKNLHPF